MQIDEPFRNQGMTIMKQVKGIVAFTMDKPKYKEIFFCNIKRWIILKIKQWPYQKDRRKNPKNSAKSQVKFKIIRIFPGKFYGTAKLQWSIFSNIKKRNCDLSKYLASTFKNIVNHTKNFIEQNKWNRLWNRYSSLLIVIY